jgi:hypothetical protein
VGISADLNYLVNRKACERRSEVDFLTVLFARRDFALCFVLCAFGHGDDRYDDSSNFPCMFALLFHMEKNVATICGIRAPY